MSTIFLFVFLCVLAVAYCQNIDPIDQLIKSEMDRQGMTGGIGLGIIYGNHSYYQGYGYADVKNSTPIDPYRSMFRWASISKTVTAITSVAGGISLDTPLSELCRTFPKPIAFFEGDKISPLPEHTPDFTMRRLLSHTAGYRSYSDVPSFVESATPPSELANNPLVNRGIDWATRRVMYQPLALVPGTKFSYTTMGFNLAGWAIEQVTGSSIMTNMERYVFRHVDAGSIQPDYEWESIPNRVVGYQQDGRPTGSDDVSWKLPGGGLISTVRDLAKYGDAVLHSAMLTAEQKSILWSPPFPESGSYALGWVTKRVNDQIVEVSHDGGQQKTRTTLHLYPADGLTLAIMCNWEGWVWNQDFLTKLYALAKDYVK
mmetsp:Transcript_4468/g.6566  ORF Transcript_4468/g.6566 Transcript_4468/m.6566 type:complete len:372 (-) Transcript_4468:247-1362(-)